MKDHTYTITITRRTMLLIFAAFVGIVVWLTAGAGCAKITEPFNDAPISFKNDAPAAVFSMPDGFSNLSTKCIAVGIRAAVAYHGDGDRAAIAMVADPHCTAAAVAGTTSTRAATHGRAARAHLTAAQRCVNHTHAWPVQPRRSKVHVYRACGRTYQAEALIRFPGGSHWVRSGWSGVAGSTLTAYGPGGLHVRIYGKRSRECSSCAIHEQTWAA